MKTFFTSLCLFIVSASLVSAAVYGESSSGGDLDTRLVAMGTSSTSTLDTRYPTSEEWTASLQMEVKRQDWIEGSFPNLTFGTQSVVSWSAQRYTTADIYRSYTLAPGSWVMIDEDYGADEWPNRIYINDRDTSPDGKAFYRIDRHPTP